MPPDEPPSRPIGTPSSVAAVAPTPLEIYRRAVVEGERRLAASKLELLANGFNAGFTVVFGLVAVGIVQALAAPRLGAELARLLGAAGLGLGVVFLVVSRAELFTENFFDPVAAAFDRRGGVVGLLRLWGVVLLLNLLGGALLVLLVSVDGVLPHGSREALAHEAATVADEPGHVTFVNALVGGALVTLLSFLLQAVGSVGARMAAAFLVGYLLAVGPFAHGVVTFLHLLLGTLAGAPIGVAEIASTGAVTVAGNLVGGIGFVTLAHIAQARGEGGG